MVGRDGVVGGSAALDGKVALNRGIVQIEGAASILDVAILRKTAEQSLNFRTALIRHEQALFAQAQQSAACNASHKSRPACRAGCFVQGSWPAATHWA